MVESHFGLSGPPFQLNPDPAFFFDSRGHGRALAYLRYGVQQGEGFIVITGDAGTGKTTLVRTLLQQLDARQLVAAQLANTQLDATDLLLAILAAFGVRPAGTSKAAAISTVEAFLTSVAASGRRALLVVDEAQNLARPALEELRMLSNFQLGHHGLLQTFLVGQAPLRERLQSPDLEQLRQRILASYHLEGLDGDETAAYVRHRLRHVGWSGRPAFDAQALAAVHRHTGGVPRRINLLCNRVLLAACLGGREAVDEALVDETAGELVRELRTARTPSQGHGERRGAAASTAPRRALPAAGLAVPAPPHGQPGRDAVVPAARAAAVTPLARRAAEPAGQSSGTWLGLAETALAWVGLKHLSAVAARRPGQPAIVCCHPGAREAMPAVLGTIDEFAAVREVHLGTAPGTTARLHAERVLKFGALLADLRPQVVIVAGSGLATLQCALVAREQGIALVRLGAGVRHGGEPGALTTALIDRCAELLCVQTLQQRQALAAEGHPARRILRGSDPLAAALNLLSARLSSVDTPVADGRRLARVPGDAGGHGLISAQFDGDDIAAEDALPWLMLARHACRPELSWLWPVNAATERVLAAPALQQQLRAAGIAAVRCDDWPGQVALLRDARCVLAGPSARLSGEAAALGVPTVALDLRAEPADPADDGLFVRVGPSATRLRAVLRHAERQREVSPPPPRSDDGTEVLLEQLARWLVQRTTTSADDRWTDAAA